jgi:hypothetical protein
MPILLPQFYSDFYTVNINGSTFIAKSFKKTVENEASNKHYLQGSGADLVKDVQPTFYTYTIEAPMLINYYNYNSLWGIAMGLANQQIAALNNAGSFANDLLLVEFSINANEGEIMQRMVLKTSFDSSYPITANYGVVSLNPMRVAKNYDLFVNVNGLLTNIYLDAADFTVKFENSNKTFVNIFDAIIFVVKSYTVEQKFSIVGTEGSQLANNYAAGTFNYQNTTITMQIGTNPTFLNYTLPLIVKARTDEVGANQFVKTDLDFSLYGTTQPTLFY